MDRYGDSYLSDVDASDVDLLLRDHMRAFRLEGGMLEGLSEESEFEGGAQEARLVRRQAGEGTVRAGGHRRARELCRRVGAGRRAPVHAWQCPAATVLRCCFSGVPTAAARVGSLRTP